MGHLFNKTHITWQEQCGLHPPPWFFAAEHLRQGAWGCVETPAAPSSPKWTSHSVWAQQPGSMMGSLPSKVLRKSYARWVVAPALLLQLLLCQEDPGGEVGTVQRSPPTLCAAGRRAGGSEQTGSPHVPMGRSHTACLCVISNQYQVTEAAGCTSDCTSLPYSSCPVVRISEG